MNSYMMLYHAIYTCIRANKNNTYERRFAYID